MNFQEYACLNENSANVSYESHKNVRGLIYASYGVTEITLVATNHCVFMAPSDHYRSIPLIVEVATIQNLEELEQRGIYFSGTMSGEVLMKFEEVRISSVMNRTECIDQFPDIILGRLRKPVIGKICISFWNSPDAIRPCVKEQVRNMLVASGQDPRDVIVESVDRRSSFREWCRIPASLRGGSSKYDNEIQTILPGTVHRESAGNPLRGSHPGGILETCYS